MPVYFDVCLFGQQMARCSAIEKHHNKIGCTSYVGGVLQDWNTSENIDRLWVTVYGKGHEGALCSSWN